MKMFRRCPCCHNFFALKKAEKTLIGTEEVKIPTVFTQPHLKGEILKAGEGFVKGQRKIYEIKYVCRFCGEMHTKLKYKIIKKITEQF